MHWLRQVYDFIYGENKGVSFIVLISFLVTFIIARSIIYMMDHNVLPDWYLFMGQTHVHHLNYGIFLLSISGYLSLVFNGNKITKWLGIIYGVGLGLTFDEFAIWFHLNDNYYARLSYEAVVVIAALLINVVYFGDLWEKIFYFIVRRKE